MMPVVLLRPSSCQTSPLNVRRIGGVTMAENHSSTRAPKTRKPHRCQADEDLVARFICHANSTHVLQSLWRGLMLEPPITRKPRRYQADVDQVARFICHANST